MDSILPLAFRTHIIIPYITKSGEIVANNHAGMREEIRRLTVPSVNDPLDRELVPTISDNVFKHEQVIFVESVKFRPFDTMETASASTPQVNANNTTIYGTRATDPHKEYPSSRIIDGDINHNHALNHFRPTVTIDGTEIIAGANSGNDIAPHAYAGVGLPFDTCFHSSMMVNSIRNIKIRAKYGLWLEEDNVFMNYPVKAYLSVYAGKGLMYDSIFGGQA
jgi:hypothetical protein